jgi:hypothetical protein
MAFDGLSSRGVLRRTLQALGHPRAVSLPADALEPVLRSWAKRPAMDRLPIGGAAAFTRRYPAAAGINTVGSPWR